MSSILPGSPGRPATPLYRVPVTRPVLARSLRGPRDEAAAWEVDPIRAAWRKHLRSSLRWLGVGVVMGAFVAVFVLVVDGQDRQLLRTGVRTQATVLGGDEGGSGRSFSGPSVDVEFVVAGELVRTTVQGETPAEHPRGSRLTVVYDRGNPDRVRSESYGSHGDAIGWVLVIPAVVGLPALVVGAWGVLAAVRWRRWLRRWAPVRSTVTERTRPRTGLHDLQLLHIVTSSPPVDVVARVTGAARWMDVADIWSGETAFEGAAFVSAGRHRRAVVVDPDVDKPVEVRLPWTNRQARRWRRSFDRALHEVG